MSRDDLVDVPEYALGEERIAFGLTAPQLAILVGAGGRRQLAVVREYLTSITTLIDELRNDHAPSG